MTDSTIREELIRRYSSPDQRQQEHYLAEVGYWLTLDGRTTYDMASGGVVDGAKIRAINEASHRIFGHFTDMMAGAGHDQRRSDACVANLLVDLFQGMGLDPVRLLNLLP